MLLLLLFVLLIKVGSLASQKPTSRPTSISSTDFESLAPRRLTPSLQYLARPIRRFLVNYGGSAQTMITIDSQPVEDVLRFCKDKDEINALASMRATVCEKLEVMTADDFEGLQQERPDAYGNLRLLRCLRKAKVQDPVSSADRFLRYISWRVENGVDELSLDNGVLSFCKENFNVEVGREVSIKVGDWNTRKLLKAIDSTQQSMSTQQFLHFWVLTYEEIHRHLHRLSMEDGKR